MGTLTWRQSMRMYIQDVWNKCDLTAITLFIVGVICRYSRYNPLTVKLGCIDTLRPTGGGVTADLFASLLS